MNHDHARSVYEGIAVAGGIGIGPARIMDPHHVPAVVPRYVLPDADLDRELARFRQACEDTAQELERLVARIASEVGRYEADILRPQVMMVKDPVFMQDVEEHIRHEKTNCEAAVDAVIGHFETMMESLDDSYLRERGADIRDAGRRILSRLLFVEGHLVGEPEEPVVVVSTHLTPSLTVHLDRSRVLAFATEKGGYNSHAAILARSLGIPAVTGLKDIRRAVKPGQMLIVDGLKGLAICDPHERQLRSYERAARRLQADEASIVSHVAEPAATRDGLHVRVMANIGRDSEIDNAVRYGVDGVGLYRTEFNYMSHDALPSEEELLEEYADVARRFGDKGVALRILDIGGDKFPSSIPLAHEDNPFIGMRGLRLMLAHSQDLMMPQLRAILRAADHGTVSVLYPMVTCVEDLEAATGLLRRAMQQLQAEHGRKVPAHAIRQGIMIEVPSCVPMLEELLEMVDFATVGTNDFVQYLLAADRNSARMVEAYDPYQPAVLRTLAQIARQAGANNKPLSLCGEVGSDVTMLPVLLGLGYAALSVNVHAVPYVRNAIRRLSKGVCERLAAQALRARRGAEVRDLVRAFREEQPYDRELRAVGL